MKTYKINVTSLDIQRGIRSDTERCAIARAVRRAFRVRRYVKVVVDADVSNQDGSNQDGLIVGNKSYPLPQRALKFIDAFDSGEDVKPFSFTIRQRQ